MHIYIYTYIYIYSIYIYTSNIYISYISYIYIFIYYIQEKHLTPQTKPPQVGNRSACHESLSRCPGVANQYFWRPEDLPPTPSRGGKCGLARYLAYHARTSGIQYIENCHL